MKKLLLLSLVTILPQFASAADLTLPGEKWLALHDKFVCGTDGKAVRSPSAFENLKVTFEQVTTDSTLDNALLKATFVQDGVACRYNAIMFADNAAQTYALVQSIAYSPAVTDGSAFRVCSAGKDIIDTALNEGKYLYYGHPHSLAFMMSGMNAQALCGNGATAVGVNFTLKGRIQ